MYENRFLSNFYAPNSIMIPIKQLFPILGLVAFIRMFLISIVYFMSACNFLHDEKFFKTLIDFIPSFT
jgi:hypothetical protein